MITVERAVLERVALVPGLFQVPLVEGIRVGDDQGTGAQVVEVRLEGGRVHRHQAVGVVAGGEDVPIGNVHLEGGHAGDRSGRGANLGGEVGQGRQVVAEQGGGGGEPIPGELHPIAGVSGKANDDLLEDGRLGSVFGLGSHDDWPSGC